MALGADTSVAIPNYSNLAKQVNGMSSSFNNNNSAALAIPPGLQSQADKYTQWAKQQYAPEAAAYNMRGEADQDLLLGVIPQTLTNGQQQAQNTYQAGMGKDQADMLYNNQMMGLTNQGFNLQNQAAQQQAGVQNRALTSSGTANGSLQTQGTRQGFTDIGNTLANTQAQTSVQRQESNDNLTKLSKELGIDETSLKNSLQSGLEGLKLTGAGNADTILEGLGRLTNEQYSDTRSFADWASQNYPGYMSTQNNGTSGATGGKTSKNATTAPPPTNYLSPSQYEYQGAGF